MGVAEDISSSVNVSTAENNIQPFFVLHRASQQRKPVAKRRRKIDLSPKTTDGLVEECKDNLRSETFNSLWSNTESFIKDALKDANADVFAQIAKWVHESFDAIRAWGKKLDFNKATRPFPVLFSADIAEVASRKIFTALLFTRNIESVDDTSTFVDLAVHLRSSSCNVAILSSLDFSTENGIGGCLKALFSQLLNVGIDVPDMSVLASWYAEQVMYESPLIVLIEEVERCCSSVLTEFISMLREWVIKLPIILIFGVATTMECLRDILSSNTCLYLSISEYTLKTPTERMNAVMEAILIKSCERFIIGNQVATFLRDHFLKYDGTLTLFIRALKISMIHHIYIQPSSFTLPKLEDDGSEACCHQTGSEVKRLCKLWSSMFMCLYEVGKYRKITLLDMYCEILGGSHGCDGDSLRYSTISMLNDQLFDRLKDDGYLTWSLKYIRDLSVVKVSNLLKRWEILTVETEEIHQKVKELQQLSALEVDDPPNNNISPASKRLTARKLMNKKADKTTFNEKVATFLQWMVRQCIDSIEKMPSDEIIFFDNVDKLQNALVGDPRRRIQADLLESSTYLKCSCCSMNNGGLVPSVHNTSIMYSLAQEHGDLINLHEWFRSFKAVSSPSSPPPSKAKKSRTSPSPGKLKNCSESKKKTNAAIQAEFCRAVTELQIAGLLRLPTKRRPDFVQRVAFGL